MSENDDDIDDDFVNFQNLREQVAKGLTGNSPRLAIGPWDVIEHNGLDFFEGLALTHMMCWRHEGGTSDLRAAIQLLEKIIEREEAGCYRAWP